MSQLVLGVDLDGVCADFYERMRVIAAEWFEKPISRFPKEVSYGLPEWGIKSDEEYQRLHRFAVTQRALFETMPLIPGARRYLRMLSNEGHRIRIITHRLFIPYFHSVAVKQTVEWLDSNGIPYWDLCFMESKTQVGADVYIEDNPNNVKNLRDSGLYTICFAHSSNVGTPPPRANSWKEAYQLIGAYSLKRDTANQA